MNFSRAGQWSDPANWSSVAGGIPNPSDDIVIDGDGVTASVVHLDQYFDLNGTLVIDADDSLVIDSGASLTDSEEIA